MKKNIKKIIVGIFGFALLFVAQNAFAATWNGASNDCKGISIVNATTNEGYAHPCWPSSSISADAGDTLNVRVYYHNTGTVTANNTRVVLSAPTGSASTTKSFSGSISSDQGGLSLGSVVANLSSSQTITFNSVKWYTNNTSETLTSLPNGQSGSEILSGGLNIGSIAPGWATQGSLVVSFHVSNTVAPQLCKDTSATNYNGALPCRYPQKICTISNFSASDYSITSGESSTLSWNTTNCASANISPTLGSVNTSGSRNVSPTANITYTLRASGNGTTDTDTVTINVSAVPPQPSSVCVINNFSSNPTSITHGDSSVLSWSTSGCTSVSVSPIVGSANTSDSEIVFPEQTTTYTLTARKGTSIAQTRAVTIYVQEVPPQQGLCKDTSANNYNETLPCTYPPQLCKDTSATNYNGALPCEYSHTSSQCIISDFSASDLSIEDGDTTILRWNTNNCESVKISDIGNVNDDGSKSIQPNEDTTYILTAYDEDGSHQTDSVKIYVDENNNDDNLTCSIDSFTASNTYINRGDSIKLKWSTSDCESVNISNVGEVDDDGSENVSPSSTITYILRAYGDNDESRSIQVRVNYNQIIQPIQIYNTNVVTTIATNVSQTGAQVNGLITSSDYNNSNVYFEYGTTINMGMRTASRSTSGNTNFSEYLTNLSPKTIYFFQALSEGSNGVSRGAIELFQTVGSSNVNTNTSTRTNTIIKEVVVQGTTVTSSESPIMLRIENRYQTIGVGDIIDYTVYYKNISSSILTHPMVQVYIPQGITLLNSSRGTYSENDRTLSAPIEDLYPDQEGTIYLQARVDDINFDLAQIVTTAILVYTNPNGAQENAMAYVLNNPKIINGNLLGASAFFGGFLGLGLIGWLILIILILLLILIARSLYNQKRRNVVTTKTEKTISQ